MTSTIKRRECDSCGESYTRGRLRCPNCGKENDLIRDGIPVEAMTPARSVRLRGLIWLAVGLALIVPFLLLEDQIPRPVNGVEEKTVLWTPFFKIVRGPERKTHLVEIPSIILLVAAFVCCCKGWAETLTGIRCTVLLKLNPANGWPELRGWLLLLSSIVLSLTTMFGCALLLNVFGIPLPWVRT